MKKEFIDKVDDVEKFVESIISKAIENNASDIHFEPREDNFYIRYRIDGELIDVYEVDFINSSVIISRVKIISDMDITIRRMPQDGRLDFLYKDRKVDIRVASIPVINGEKIVMRILNSSNFEIDIDNLGLYPSEKKIIEKIINVPNGVLIISGPTGSGKSSTLYSFIKKLKKESINIITLEDPVEVRINGINQININSNVGLDFATGLRAMLRQDFEIGLVGEMRDKETANIALRAGITGHLIFTTLHTADTVSSIIRLLNLGIENYVISSGVVAILAQRLVRKLCPHCKTKRKPMDFEKNILKKYSLDVPDFIYSSAGCDKCNGGYLGRTLILEYLIFDDELKEIINSDCNSIKLYNYFSKKQCESLYKNGLRKVVDGITSFEEVDSILFSLGEINNGN
ncbi:MAG: GspE/PulE family protein [Peptoniphilaceae bacterium]|uniref:GspE/PulE family protein n=1 Tax=Parvimonas sp. TaxID=1944660 RepID=UPI0025DF7EF1|nr:GspE/PulE family protein [Parvimonas sp.]MCI5997899.1 GspE/PulE family protein [Parvimonas sp.]MDD7764502.1 GspE/PulE family protein [Peptoniphilaceae bacterium]MDY3050481.1 GspE/PulE family protein [Parvimonas sp.]